jgi:hypothetical protein
MRDTMELPEPEEMLARAAKRREREMVEYPERFALKADHKVKDRKLGREV